MKVSRGLSMSFAIIVVGIAFSTPSFSSFHFSTFSNVSLNSGERTNYEKNGEEATKLLAVGSFKAKPELDRAELAAWTLVANTLLNLDETITRN